MVKEHECEPQPTSPQTDLPTQWTCPECGTVWIPEMPRRERPFPPVKGVDEPYWSWTWAKRVA